ncbi:heterokaryon incompatibility, partial [Setomelanomma holmii]
SLPQSLPRTVTDAIVVTKALIYRYLWVDELCINQGDTLHRDSQIKKMDQIYRGADLTIVAAAGDHKHHGLPGVGSPWRTSKLFMLPGKGAVLSIGPDPMGRIWRSSTWWKRAWTFQEGYLSRRLLVFTDNQMLVLC